MLLRVNDRVGTCNPTAGVGEPKVMHGGSEQMGQLKVTRLAYQKRESILETCHINHSPIASTQLENEARKGSARWEGNKLVFGGPGTFAYWYLPDMSGNVSYCVVPRAMGMRHAYVVSDNYGGCEYHELFNPSTGEMAFLHVYRGDLAGMKSRAVEYKLLAPWTLLRKMLSTDFTSTLPTVNNQFPGNVWSVSYIDRSGDFPVTQSQFICQKNGVVTHVHDYGIAQ